jgi:rhodanese-related sulfurtransferase
MQEITVEQLKNRAAAGEKLNVIDVREPDEYQAFNIGAKLIPLGTILSMQIDDLEDLKNEELIIHCHAGKRSMQACMVLEQIGFTNTVNVIGGVSAWQQVYGNEKL